MLLASALRVARNAIRSLDAHDRDGKDGRQDVGLSIALATFWTITFFVVPFWRFREEERGMKERETG